MEQKSSTGRCADLRSRPLPSSSNFRHKSVAVRCCQVSVEERLAQSEKRISNEAQKQFDLELAELRERIETVQKVCRTR